MPRIRAVIDVLNQAFAEDRSMFVGEGDRPAHKLLRSKSEMVAVLAIVSGWPRQNEQILRTIRARFTDCARSRDCAGRFARLRFVQGEFAKMSSAVPPSTTTRSRRRKGGEGLRIHQSIARKIGIAILNGTYEPGSTLGGEIEASERLAYRAPPIVRRSAS
jgi:hypothetical protein